MKALTRVLTSLLFVLVLAPLAMAEPNAHLNVVGGTPGLTAASGHNLTIGTEGDNYLNILSNGSVVQKIKTGVSYESALKRVIGSSSALSANITTITTATPLLSILGSSATQAQLIGIQNGANAVGVEEDVFKTRATSGSAASTIVNSGDVVWQKTMYAADGTGYDPVARISAKIDATPGAATDMPGALYFYTVPDGSVTLTQALKLDSSQNATFAGSVQATGGVIMSASVFETVAAGTSAQGDGPLSATKFIHLVTGFDETKVATLPACASGDIGKVHFILNSVTNKFAKIFPASGGAINSLGANAAYTQGVTGQGGKVLLCACQAANQWYCA